MFEEVPMPESNICTERFYFLPENVSNSMYFYGINSVVMLMKDIFIHVFEVI